MKKYDALAPQTQSLIDAAIFLELLKEFPPEQGGLPPPSMMYDYIDNLRAVYVEDVQRTSPRHHQWHSCGREYTERVTASIASGGRGQSPEDFKWLIDRLENLPYSQPPAPNRDPRQR